MNKSNPSFFGKLTATVFDEYPLYKCEISPDIINNYLPDKLSPFGSVSLKNVAKKEFFYSKPIIFASRSQLSDHFEELSYSDKMEGLLKDLLSKTNNIVRYNFVITGNDLILVRIAHTRHFSYHILCKHITLSNRSEDVRFAGELWCDENGTYQLSNNSGTYRPPHPLIEKTVQLFNQLTPRLQLQGNSFQINSRPSFKRRLALKIRNKRKSF